MPSKVKYILLIFIISYCAPLWAVLSIEDSCFHETRNLIPRYFAGQSHYDELDKLYTCTTKVIEFTIDHTQTGSPDYYTQVELRRFIQYLSAKTTKEQAIKMSYAFLHLKTGLLGGHKYRLSLKEIDIFKKILFFIKKRMKALHSTMPIFIKAMNHKKVPRITLLKATQKLEINFQLLGEDLSKLNFVSNLSMLKQMPRDIKTLDVLDKVDMPYWANSMSLLTQLKGMVLDSKKETVKTHDWSFIFNFSGRIISLWLYYKNFLQHKEAMHVKNIPHLQYMLSHSLNLIRKAKKISPRKNIYLHDIDILANKLWFVPYTKKPIFRLGSRSLFCFLLNPLVTKKTCNYSMNFQQEDLKISFPDLTFTVNNNKKITEFKSNNISDKLEIEHLDILRTYLNYWIDAENKLRKTNRLPILFGSTHLLLKRNLNLTKDRRLQFTKRKYYNVPLLSHLNWQSQLMKILVSAYTHRTGKPITPALWNTMIKEWTAFNVSINENIQIPWKQLQKIGFNIFKHGDFLTSQSNGDNILQGAEILELFSLFSSALKTVFSAKKIIQKCETPNKRKHFFTFCIWNTLYSFPSSIFNSFPKMVNSLNRSSDIKNKYFSKLQETYHKKETLSLSNLFEMFLFFYYQENTMEYLDKNRSQSLSTQELEPFLDIFENTLIEDVPFIYSKKEAFAYITYFFHVGRSPIFGEKKPISSPLHFYNWLLQPQKWKLHIKREDIFNTLFLLNNNIKTAL